MKQPKRHRSHIFAIHLWKSVQRALSFRVFPRLTLVLVLLALPLFSLTHVGVGNDHAYAATSDNLNFQARLETAAGAIAADGYYNLEFKLYTTTSGGSALWTETYTGANKVRVANGYITVNLGSLTSFPSTIPWDQQLYLTMNVGGTGASASWDGEMNPRLKLTAVPYAFNAKTASELTKSNVSGTLLSTLSIQAPTGGNQLFQIPDQGAGGTYTLLTQNTANGAYIQNQNGAAQAANYWINGTARADTAIITPALRPTADGTTAFQIQNAAGTATVMNVDTTNGTATFQAIDTNGATITTNTVLVIKNAAGQANVEIRASDNTSNTFIGLNSGQANTTGGYNTTLGSNSLQSNTTGGYNTTLGSNSLQSNTTGSYNTAFGYSAGYQDSGNQFKTLNNLQRSTSIGAYAQVTQDNAIVLGSVDTLTKVGIGITSPQNQFSVSPVNLNSTSITATQSGNTVTSSGAIFSAVNVGETLVWADDGTTAQITAYTDSTHVEVSTSVTKATATYFRTHKAGLQVTNTGKIGIGTVSPASKLTIAQDSQNASEGLSVMEGGAGRIGLYTGTGGVSYLDFTNNAAKIRQTNPSSTLGIESSREIVLSTSANVSSGMKFDVMGSRVLNIDTAGNGTGDALFRNRLDSASAFAIQNSSNTSLFTADTTNSRIQVGSATTDATAILFGLDSYNNGTDPTGFNGAMYYNTSTNKFRCFENSAWANCAASAENVIQNQSAAAQTTATFWIQGSGRSNASFLAPQFDAATGIALSLGTTNATSITIGKGTVGTVLASSTITAGTSGSATTLQGAAQLTANTAGNDFTIKGSAGNGTGNGGTLLISGGDAGATGTMGLVSLNPTSFAAQTAQTLGSSQTLNQAWINNYSTLPLIASNTGLTFTVPAPAISTVGRVYYISNAGTNDFNILLNGTNINIALKANSTATLIWNGNGWTAAGASSATDLQAAYNNTLSSAGAAELVLNAPGGAADGLTIRNNGTPITGALFEVQSSIATNLFSVNNNTIEYAVNGGAENTTLTAWSNYNAGVTTKTTAAGTFATGLAGVNVATSATNQGAKNTLSTALPAGNYVVSFAAKLSSGGPSTFNIWYSANGTAQTAACNTSLPGTGYTISPNFTVSTSWTKVSCFIIVPSGGTATNAILIANQSNISFYLDNLSVISNAATTTPANVQIGGGATGGQPTLFTLDQFAGPPMSTTNAAYFGSMYYDTSIGAIQCYQSSGWGACGSAPDDIISMTPEYTGAVLNGTGVGTMTADFCANSAALTVGTLCSSNEARNFYKWTSPQATAQSYSIYVTYRLPSTFKSFKNGTMSLNGLTDSTTNAGVKYALFRKSQGGGVAQCSADTAALGSANTWTQIAPTTDITSSTCGVGQPNAFVAGDTLIIRITVNAQSNASAYVENLTFQYSNK